LGPFFGSTRAASILPSRPPQSRSRRAQGLSRSAVALPLYSAHPCDRCFWRHTEFDQKPRCYRAGSSKSSAAMDQHVEAVASPLRSQDPVGRAMQVGAGRWPAKVRTAGRDGAEHCRPFDPRSHAPDWLAPQQSDHNPRTGSRRPCEQSIALTTSLPVP
jgi:hypothetical protein